MHSDIAKRVLEKNLKDSIDIFDSVRKVGAVSGDFNDLVWGYKGSRLLFTEIGAARLVRSRQIKLSERAGQIARCYCARNLLLHVSPELAASRLNAFRHLALRIGARDEYWHEMPVSVLNQTVSELWDTTKITTTYHRATALKDFVNFLNTMHCRVGGVEQRFCDRLIKWKHGIRNPIRSKLELTSRENESRRENLYDAKLHIAIAKAAFILKSNPSLESLPGSDRIRLESLAFALALGLRVGEVCSLPKRSLDYDEDTELSSLIVATEKGTQAGAVAIAKVWESIVKDAYDYLVESCSEARNRAQQIEMFGFRFVIDTLNLHRIKQPLSVVRLKQIESIGLEVNQIFFIDEMVSAFELSSKEFSHGGHYNSCSVPLPQEVGARIATWLDLRFTRWDWNEHAKYFNTNGWRVRFEDIIIGAGVSKSSLIKAKWFVDDLRDFMSDMHQQKLFDSNHFAGAEIIAEHRARWLNLRIKVLGNVGGKFLGIDILKFIDVLKIDYTRYLSSHFKEEFSSEGNSSGGGYAGNNSRPGMETMLSEHLIVVWQNQFRGRGERGIIPRPMLRSDLYNYLSDKGGKKTVFERLGILDDDGKPYSITPHQIRRWLTTALLRSGPNETAIDLWMGRKPRQTRHYDYRTAKERAEFVRSRYVENSQLPSDMLGKKVKIWRDEGVSAKEIESLVTDKLKALHYTPWGTCSRELYISPCTKGLMCLRGFGTSSGCDSFQVDPADIEAKAAIIKLKEQYSAMLAAITTNKHSLMDDIMKELDTAEPLDQHVAFIIDIVKGCDAALQNYINVNSIGE